MFIINPDSIKNKVKYNGLVAKFLVANGVPLLARKNNEYYFANTEILKSALDNSPLWVKLLLFSA
jgi:hypothetical protein